MSIDLTYFEAGAPYAGDGDAALALLGERLARVQAAHIVHRRAAIVMLEGWDAAGKGAIIARLTAGWDARRHAVWPIGAPDAAARAHHFLQRFWARLPAAGEIALFDRGWYGRVLADRVEGQASEVEWRRAYDEINAFEGQLADNGVTLVKLFVHIGQAEQDRRLAARLDSPWARWKVGADDFRDRARRPDYLAAMHEMFAETDTRWAPWTVIDGGDPRAAEIAALGHVADRLERAVPAAMPDIDPGILELARAAFGYAPPAEAGDADQSG